MIVTNTNAIADMIDPDIHPIPSKTVREECILDTLILILELMSRGIEMLPVDVSKSDAVLFTVEDGKIRIPIEAVRGCGKFAALKIKEAVDNGGCASVDEIQ